MHKLFDNGLFYSVSQFYKEKFGVKVYKLSLDAGCTCPTRDGTKGNRGCIFCSARGSGDFSQDKNLSITEQIEKAKNLVLGKVKSGKFIAYFQNFTNTYGDSEVLLKKFQEAVSCNDICGLSIATRADCVSDEILEKLKKIADKTFLSIELGLQTSSEKSAEYIRRGFSNKEFRDCVKKIKNAIPDCHVVTHIILGLPSEDFDTMMASVQFALDSGTDGLKLSLLHVLKDTDLYSDYQDGKVPFYSKEEYLELLGKIVVNIPEDIVLHRLTGDGPKSLLISPLWTAQKKDVYNSMIKYFSSNSIKQGKCLY